MAGKRPRKKDVTGTFSRPQGLSAEERDASTSMRLSHVDEQVDERDDHIARLEAELKIARDDLQKTKALAAELQHRVRNTLSIVRSIARRSVENSDDVEDYAFHLEGRINALARTHNVLMRSASATVQLDMLVLDELASQGGRTEDQFTIDGPDISLSGKAAETLGLAFHELATNSMKYGALSAADKSISVSWKVDGTPARQELKIRWIEDLHGPAAIPARRGFGSELIEKVVPYEIGGAGSLRFTDAEVICTMDIPLSNEIHPSTSLEEPPDDFQH
ncbi:sensor histidine kinase [Mesorhizobium sp. B292B1B]|uniref:sensor histidine kinase n=1 Tax=unclassified Mesorhizobium TaxID=325217 RepID=UPI00112DE147|nr:MULTISPECIES: sensor histidine kinase [unclassified Mesorhizobium]MCA0015711.1 sensor histidine kinase [Mesorhizobium sp. B294B1A1]MCA0041565.1 sensor histidine kinase [Mesorhizobium sp. B292B1B]TPM39783.1 sensor histidine kinase [Mesorhizobium sp. B2-3-2]